MFFSTIDSSWREPEGWSPSSWWNSFHKYMDCVRWWFPCMSFFVMGHAPGEVWKKAPHKTGSDLLFPCKKVLGIMQIYAIYCYMASLCNITIKFGNSYEVFVVSKSESNAIGTASEHTPWFVTSQPKLLFKWSFRESEMLIVTNKIWAMWQYMIIPSILCTKPKTLGSLK